MIDEKSRSVPVHPDGGLFPQLWRFCLVGVAGFALNGGLVEILAPALGLVGAQAVAFPAAVTLTWGLNRHYTFGASGFSPRREWLRYALANCTGWLLNNTAYLLLVLWWPLAAVHPSLAVAGGSLAGLTANFVLSRRLVFRRPA